MASDFAHARELLEHAWLKLSGDDETSVKSRQALDLLIEAVASADYRSLTVRPKSANSDEAARLSGRR